MKRKVYVTDQERRADQIKGFLAFPIVNGLLWIILQLLYAISPTEVPAANESVFVLARWLIFVLPWLVNGSVLALAFVFRSQFAIGYIAFIGIALAVVVGLSMLFVAACFVVLSAASLWVNPNSTQGTSVFVVLVIVAVCVLGLVVFWLFRRRR